MSLSPNSWLLQRLSSCSSFLQAFCDLSTQWGHEVAGSTILPLPYSYHQNYFVFLEDEFLQGYEPLYVRTSLHTMWLILIYFSRLEMGFFRTHIWGYWREGIAVCFTPFQKGRSDHKFIVAGPGTAFYFSIMMQKEERKRKSIFLMLSWVGSIFWNFIWGNTALWVFGWDYKAWMFWGRKH